VSSEWRPDDSLNQRNNKGQLRGALRVNAALRKNKVRLGKGVITSRDTGMAAVRRDLKRTGMPPGVESWQLPVLLGDILWFITCFDPWAMVPLHAHPQDSLRIVISGELKFGRKTLKAGDWMFVPAGQDYSVQAGSTRCCIAYFHP
jgi:hypothetical protein